MSDSRKIRAKKNIITSVLSQVVLMVCGIIVPRLMIGAFGSEAYGATSSITQFLSYITLLEGGIGGVARAVLYKPLAQNDLTRISAIMKEMRRFFRVISYIFIAYVLVLAVSFKSISQIACLDWISTAILVIVISISLFGQYFIGVSNSVLLQAAQKTYVTNIISMSATVINAIFTVLMIYFGCDLIIVKLVSSLIFFLRPVALWLFVKKQYALNNHVSSDEGRYLTQKWSGLGQHIAFFLHSNTDIAILTIFANLETVAVYAVYNMVVSNMQNFSVSFSSGMEAVFGDMLAREENEKLHNTFSMYETILSVVSMILFSTTIVLIIPFVKLYTKGITDADYIQPLFAILLILSALCYCLRQPYHAMVIAAGHFKQTSIAAYGEACLNIVLSIILVFKLGIVGVALATLIATLFRFIYYVFYLSKNIFYRNIKLFIKRSVINLSVLVCNCLIGYVIVSNISTSTYFEWIGCGMITIGAIGAVTLVMNFLFFRKDCEAMVRKIIKR